MAHGLPNRRTGWVTEPVTWAAAAKMSLPRLCQFLEQVRGTYSASEWYLVWDNGPVHQQWPIVSGKYRSRSTLYSTVQRPAIRLCPLMARLTSV